MLKVTSILLFLLTTFFYQSRDASAQMTSRGPGRGPAIPGQGSKYTHPQPPKRTPYTMASIRPAYQVPENPDRYRWVTTIKVDGRDIGGSSADVPVYSFVAGKRVEVGRMPAGQDVPLEEIRAVGKAIYYRVDWKGSPRQNSSNVALTDFWLSGSNIEFAGAK